MNNGNLATVYRGSLRADHLRKQIQRLVPVFFFLTDSRVQTTLVLGSQDCFFLKYSFLHVISRVAFVGHWSHFCEGSALAKCESRRKDLFYGTTYRESLTGSANYNCSIPVKNPLVPRPPITAPLWNKVRDLGSTLVTDLGFWDRILVRVGIWDRRKCEILGSAGVSLRGKSSNFVRSELGKKINRCCRRIFLKKYIVVVFFLRNIVMCAQLCK